MGVTKEEVEFESTPQSKKKLNSPPTDSNALSTSASVVEPNDNEIPPVQDMVKDFTDVFTTPEHFPSRKTLLDWVCAKGKEHGIVVTIGRSDSGWGNKRARILMTCDRGGQYRANKFSLKSSQETNGDETVEQTNGKKAKRKRETGTKKCGCPFRLKGKEVNELGEWELDVICGVHNHPTMESSEERSHPRRLLKHDKECVSDKSPANRVKERDIGDMSSANRVKECDVANRVKEHDVSGMSPANKVKKRDVKVMSPVNRVKEPDVANIAKEADDANRAKEPGVANRAKEPGVANRAKEPGVINRVKEPDVANRVKEHDVSDVSPANKVKERDVSDMSRANKVTERDASDMCRANQVKERDASDMCRANQVKERDASDMCRANQVKERDVSDMSCANRVKERDVSDMSHANRVSEHGGRSQIQQLIQKLEKHKYYHLYRRCEQTNAVKDLFFAHPWNIELLRAFPYVILMDCTYKTNRYKLPLLEIVGVTSTQMTFSIAATYLEFEREDNYIWACTVLKSLMDDSRLPYVIVTQREIALMKAIETTFPTSTHFLCRWHINRNIVSNCKKILKTKDSWDAFMLNWNLLVIADTESKFNDMVSRLSLDFNKFPNAVKYVMEQWVAPYKERFVSYWTNNVMHFDNMIANRVESQHAALKKQLGSNQGDFETCWREIHTIIETSHVAIICSLEKSRLVVRHKFKSNIFRELHCRVSIHALELIYDEINRLDENGVDPLLCRCVLRKTCGLPCPHELTEFIRLDSPITLNEVHAFWRKLDASNVLKDVIDVRHEQDSQFKECWTNLELKFDQATQYERTLILKSLTEISTPTTMAIEEIGGDCDIYRT